MSRASLLNYHHAQLLYHVLRARTLTDAAHALHISQPAVTKQLRQLEQSLGVPLFHRDGRRLTPTAQALMLGEQLERTQASLTTLNELAARLRSGIAGQLSICVIPAMAAALVPQVVARLHDMLPDVLLDIKVENSWRIVDLVETQQIDIGICSHFRATTHVHAAPLLKLLMVCAVRDDDALARSSSLQLTQLAGRPLALVEVFEGMAEIKSALSRSGVDEQVYCRASTSALACELALRTRGAALVDNLTAMMYRTRGLASVALPELPERSMALLRPALRTPSQFTDAFVKVLAEEAAAIQAALAH